MTVSLASGGAAYAGGIQIDPTGAGNIGLSKFIESLPATNGDLLLDNAFNDSGPLGAGTQINLLAQNGGLYMPELGGTLVWQLVLPVTVTSLSNGIKVTDGTLGADGFVSGSDFALFFLKGTSAALTTTYASNTYFGGKISGEGYGDLLGADDTLGAIQAKEIARGTAKISINDGTQRSFNVTESDTGTTYLADNHKTGATRIETIKQGGGFDVVINFTSINADGNYVVNDPTAATIDLSVTSLSPTAPFNQATNVPSASKVVGVAPNYGNPYVAAGPSYPQNDYICQDPALGGTSPCDFQAQIGAAYSFAGERVPEPESLALAGAGIIVAGFAARRRRVAAGRARVA
jgi:hypothetical protein